MKRWVIIAVAVVAVASSCGAVARAPAAGSPTASYSPAPSAANLVSLSGKNTFQSDPISIPAGKYRVAWTVHAEGPVDLFIGLIYGTDLQPQNDRTMLTDAEVPATSAGVAEFGSAGGQFIIFVEIRPNTYVPTTWTLTVAPVSTPA
jgi:hypothetical protein